MNAKRRLIAWILLALTQASCANLPMSARPLKPGERIIQASVGLLWMSEPASSFKFENFLPAVSFFVAEGLNDNQSWGLGLQDYGFGAWWSKSLAEGPTYHAVRAMAGLPYGGLSYTISYDDLSNMSTSAEFGAAYAFLSPNLHSLFDGTFFIHGKMSGQDHNSGDFDPALGISGYLGRGKAYRGWDRYIGVQLGGLGSSIRN